MNKHKYNIVEIPKKVFRAYDIRGEIDTDLSEDSYYTIGRAFAKLLSIHNRHHVYIGRDGRLSSPKMQHAIIQGLLDSGIHVTQLGQVPTPVLYFATHTDDKIDSGIIVTGSHNPANYNGIKMVVAGKTLVNSDIDELYSIIQNKNFIDALGSINERNIEHNYEDIILKTITIKKKLKIVVDAGNGIVGPLAIRLLTKLGCEVIPLYCDIDGTFPNHHPDPSVPENLQDLIQTVINNQADLGVAFDGDADRLGVVTGTGQIIWPDRLMMYFAKKMLPFNKNGPIAYDVKCSKYLKTIIEQNGGIAHMCPTGHSIVKNFMKQNNAILAGEMSGHIFFQDRWFGFDDALYAACRLLELLSNDDDNIDQQFSLIPNSVNTPEIKISISDDQKFKFMDHLLEDAIFTECELIKIDGLRVEYGNGWGLIRASNTTPCLVARFEANNQQSLKNIQDKFREQLNIIKNQIGLDLEIPF